jgi:hypothetical protein
MRVDARVAETIASQSCVRYPPLGGYGGIAEKTRAKNTREFIVRLANLTAGT